MADLIASGQFEMRQRELPEVKNQSHKGVWAQRMKKAVEHPGEWVLIHAEPWGTAGANAFHLRSRKLRTGVDGDRIKGEPFHPFQTASRRLGDPWPDNISGIHVRVLGDGEMISKRYDEDGPTMLKALDHWCRNNEHLELLDLFVEHYSWGEPTQEEANMYHLIMSVWRAEHPEPVVEPDAPQAVEEAVDDPEDEPEDEPEDDPEPEEDFDL